MVYVLREDDSHHMFNAFKYFLFDLFDVDDVVDLRTG